MKPTGFKYRDIAKILKRNGFTEMPQRGTSHIKWVRGEDSLCVKSREVNRMIWRRLCKEHNIVVD